MTKNFVLFWACSGKAQQEEIGDGANLAISFAGELLQNAEELIRMGLHPSEIISGYTKAINKACIQVCPKNPVNFNVDNVHVVKLLGGGLHNCSIVGGMVLKTDAVGSTKQVENAKMQMQLLYSKLHDKYTELKMRMESEIEQYNREQKSKFMNYISAAEEMIEHLKTASESLQAKINELTDKIIPDRNVVAKGIQASNLYLAKAWFQSSQPMTRSQSSELSLLNMGMREALYCSKPA